MAEQTRRRDLARAAWINSISYATSATNKDGTTKYSTPRRWALATWPGLLLVHCWLGHRNLFLTHSRNGVVCLYKNPPMGLAFRAAVTCIVPGFLAIAWPILRWPIGVVVGAVVVSLMLATVVTGRKSKAPKGTKKALLPFRHFVIGLAAATPEATAGETVILVHRLIEQLPAGSVVVVHPRTELLRERYEAVGFIPSEGARMIHTITENP